MRKIRRIDYQEFKKIYVRYMTVDFPKAERRPLFLIKRSFKKGFYEAYVYEENDQLLGYAGLIYMADKSYALLDYFAVMKEQRSTGVGSEFLTLLRDSISVNGLIIESENPDAADAEDEKAVRNRRIAFYQRNGAIDSGTEGHFFGVCFCLLWLPKDNAPMPSEVGEITLNIYKQTMRNWQARKYLSYNGKGKER